MIPCRVRIFETDIGVLFVLRNGKHHTLTFRKFSPRAMAAAKTTRRPRRSPLKPLANGRGAVTRSARNGKTGTKASNINKISEPDPSPPKAVRQQPEPSPPLIEQLSHATDVEPSKKKNDSAETVYDYKLIQILDYPGHTFDKATKEKVLATFDDLKKANHAAWQHYEFLAVFSEPNSSFCGYSDGMVRFGAHLRRSKVVRTVKIEVQKEERKPQAPREIFLILMEWSKLSPHDSEDKGKLGRMSTSGVYEDLESAVAHMQELSTKFRHDWMPKGKEFGDGDERDLFERVDAKEDGRPIMTLVNRTEGTLIKIRVSTDLLH